MVGDQRGISRRQFLMATAAGAAIGLIGRPAFLNAAEEPELVVISGEPEAATRKALEVLGGISRFVKQGQRVIIKPNMSFAKSPDFAATTHPLVVVAVARACIEAGAQEVLVLDHTLQRAELCLERTGIRDACKQQVPSVHVLALQDRKFFQEIKIPQGKVLTRVEVLKDILDNAVLINVPVAKHHSLSRLTLGMKNIMGVIGGHRGEIHFSIGQRLADLNTVLRPTLTVIDATRILLRNGPVGGNLADVKTLDTLMASTDPVAADAYATTLFDLKPEDIASTCAAYKAGLGEMDLKKVRVLKV